MSINITNKIYTIRGQKVMLDSDLAEIYGYETRYLNRQVQRNKGKFEGEDFMFQLTQKELEEILMCQNVTSRFDDNLKSQFVTSSWGGVRKLPYVFTEQGIYMLMTVLKGPLAIKQSRALVMAFKAMKDYILESREMLEYKDNLQLLIQVSKNQQAVSEIKDEMIEVKTKINAIDKKVDEAIEKSDIFPVFKDFNNTIEQKEYIFMNGKPMAASEAYINIYKQAKTSIYIIDNYIDIRTLRHLQKVSQGVEIIIFSDNVGHYLHKSDYCDFRKEYPELEIEFIKTSGKMHDRFIVIDSEIFYHAGASEKDVGAKISAITKLSDDSLRDKVFEIIAKLKTNQKLVLK